MAASMTKSKALEELGLTEGASDAEIKSAYRQLARLHHPDVDKNGTEKMVVINAAHERLTRYRNEPDPIERVTLKEEDPWADFDKWEREDNSDQTQNSKIGKSLYITIDVPWEVANLGRNHIISYKVLGKAKRITVKIPKGSKSGKQIRCAGKGEPGINGGISGDLFVTLNVINKGYVTDIHATLVLRSSETYTPSVRYLNVIVDGVSKRISVPVPANVRDGQTINLSGMGNRSSVGDFRGNILVKVTVNASRPGKDFETYAIVDGFLRVKMALFNGANVTLRDVKTNNVVYSSFKLEARHKDGLRFWWDDLGGVGDPGERRGKLWVTPIYTDGARYAVGILGVIAALFIALLVFSQFNGSSSYTSETYESTSEVIEEPSEEDTYTWPPIGFEFTDTDSSFAYAYYQPDEYNCSEDSALACIKLQVASEQDCTELDLQIRFYDSETGEEEWAGGQFSDFIGGIPQDVELSIYTRSFDSIDSIEIYCSIP
jgi:hypothetical protein